MYQNVQFNSKLNYFFKLRINSKDCLYDSAIMTVDGFCQGLAL